MTEETDTDLEKRGRAMWKENLLRNRRDDTTLREGDRGLYKFWSETHRSAPDTRTPAADFHGILTSLGLELRSTRHGWMICRPYGMVRVVVQEFATLEEAFQWAKDAAGAGVLPPPPA